MWKKNNSSLSSLSRSKFSALRKNEYLNYDFSSHASGWSLSFIEIRILKNNSLSRKKFCFRSFLDQKIRKSVRIWQIKLIGLRRDHPPAFTITSPASVKVHFVTKWTYSILFKIFYIWKNWAYATLITHCLSDIFEILFLDVISYSWYFLVLVYIKLV